MRNDIAEAKKRLNEARKVTDLSAAHRDLLCDIINAEISDSLAGFYNDIPIQVYHHPLCTGYSSTLIKRLIEQSFNHAFLEKNGKSGAFRFGSAFHTFCNEPHLFETDYIVAPVSERRSKEFKATKARAGNRIVLTADEFKAIEVMSGNLFRHPDASPLLAGAKFEHTFFSRDSKTGLWKRCRSDLWKGLSVGDLKTCMNASPVTFAMDAKRFLYRISAAWYLGVISEATGISHEEFYLIACEKEAPWEIAVYKVSQQSIERAQLEIRQALDTIRVILDEGEKAWRGFQLGIKEIAI